MIVCTLAVLASLAGGLLVTRSWVVPGRLQVMLGMVAGFLLGLALLHLLPHAAVEMGSVEQAMLWALAGFLVLFVLQRITGHLPHPESAKPEAETRSAEVKSETGEGPTRSGPVMWVAAWLGLSLHSVLDGLALTAGVLAWHLHGPAAGLPVLFAVLLHKPVDALALCSLMRRAACTPRRITIVNVLYALTAPLGAVLFSASWSSHATDLHRWEALALAFSGGMFLCIAACELLPELPFAQPHTPCAVGALAVGLTMAIVPLWWHNHGETSHEFSHGASAACRHVPVAGAARSSSGRAAPGSLPVFAPGRSAVVDSNESPRLEDFPRHPIANGWVTQP